MIISVFHKGIRLFNHGCAFGFFRAVICKGNARIFITHNMFHIKAAEFAELIQKLRPAFGVCAAVQQHKRLFGAWHNGRNTRPLNAFDPFGDQRCTHGDRACVSRRNKRVSGAFIQKPKTGAHAGIRFLPEHTFRVIRHQNIFTGRMRNLRVSELNMILFYALCDPVFIADKKYIRVERINGHLRAFDDLKRRVISSERVNNNPHRF